jgi:thyroid adenoma-associated protein
MLSLRCTSPSSRNRLLPLLSALLRRVRFSVAAAEARPRAMTPAIKRDIAACRGFLRWLVGHVLGSIYPGSVFERRFMALETLCLLLSEFGTAATAGGSGLSTSAAAPASAHHVAATIETGGMAPMLPELGGEGVVDLLLGSVLDPWDKIRDAAERALLALPPPSDAGAARRQAEGMLARGAALARSARAKESDAGARIVRLAFKKYVAGAGIPLRLPSSSDYDIGMQDAEQPSEKLSKEEAVLRFMESCCDAVKESVIAGQRDMLAACRTSLAHGPLLVLRYLIPEVPWDATCRGLHAAATRANVARLLQLVTDVVDLVLPARLLFFVLLSSTMCSKRPLLLPPKKLPSCGFYLSICLCIDLRPYPIHYLLFLRS